MTATASRPPARAPRIDVVVPDLFDIGGGISRISRALVMAVSTWAAHHEGDVRVHALRDRGGRRDPRYLPPPAEYRGYAADRRRLSMAIVARAWRRPGLTIFGHTHLAALSVGMPSWSKVAVVAHGKEVWDTLRLDRRLGLRRADEVWPVSRMTAESLVAVHGVRRERIHLMLNALDPFWPLPEHPQPGMKHLLMVARLNPGDRYKGIDLTLRALARLPAGRRPRLVVVGEGEDRPRLEIIARDLALDVAFAGGVDDEQLQRLYADALGFVLPSTGEGFGLVYLEAMANALPVIAARAGGAPEVVEHGVTGLLIAPGDEVGLAKAIDALDPEMGRVGRARLEREFLYPRYAADVAQALDRLLG
ncbi:MAG: glycosyltransferase family 4 protein [Myxococcota bacterium]